MKKSIYWMLVLLFAVVATTLLFACSWEKGKTEQEKSIVSFTVNVPDKTFAAGQVDYSDITLVLRYSDGTESGLIPLTEEMIDPKDMFKLSVVGVQQVTVIYPGSGKSAKATIRIVEPDPVYYTVRIVGGYVYAVNGETVVAPVLPDGDEVLSQQYESGTTITLHWMDVSGRNFAYWTADDVRVSEDSIYRVTVNGDVTYRAYDSAIVYTVYFEMGIKDGVTADGKSVVGIESKRTDVLYASDIETLDHDQYVFVGWTTDKIDYDQARSGYSKNIVRFPYRVARDVIFYGVWTPRGLSYAATEGGYAVDGFVGDVKSLVIPQKYNDGDVVGITRDAFRTEHGRQITDLTLPETIRWISEGAFSSCVHLEKFILKGSSAYSVVDDVLYTTDARTLVAYPAAKVAASYAVGEETKAIATRAFYGAVVGNVLLPSGIVSVGERAFDSVHINAVDFRSVMPTGLTVGSVLFNDLISLVRVSEGSREGFLTIDAFRAFSSRVRDDQPAETGVYTATEADGKTSKTLYRVVYEPNFENTGATAEILGVSGNVENYVVQKVTQDDHKYPVSSIASRAFDGCDGMKAFRIPIGSSLERICDNVFDETKWFAESAGTEIVANGIFYKYFGNETTVAIETSVTKIAEGAFRENPRLRYIDVTNNANLRDIMSYAFYKCENLVGFICTPNKSGDGVYLKSYVRSVGAYAFYGTAISRVIMQDESNVSRNALSFVGEYAFGYCDRLLSVQLSSSLSDLASTAYVGCYALERFVLADRNVTFAVFDGILYRKDESIENGYSVYAYPAGRMDKEFTPSERKNYATAIEKDENAFLKAGTNGKVGTISFNGVKNDLYMNVASDVNKAFLSENSDRVIRYNGALLRETTAVEYDETGKIIPNGQKYFYFYGTSGAARAILYDEKTREYYCEETLTVTAYGEYAFWYSNFAALYVPASVQEIEENALFIPGLLYVRFESTPISTYASMFDGCEPAFIVTQNSVSQNDLRSYFQNNQELINAKNRNASPYVFFFAYDEERGEYDDAILYAYDTESEVSVKTYVIRSSRSARSISVPLAVYANEEGIRGLVASASAKKIIFPYAFYGGNLVEVYLRGVEELRDHAFERAYAMVKLDLTSDFIATLGENVFGEKLNNGLYLYDYRNGVDLYYNTKNWGLEFFDYIDVYGDPQIASRYLIRSENGAFAVITTGDENARGTVEIAYGTIEVDDVKDLQTRITKVGYDISNWTDFDGNVIGVAEAYTIPYNLVLVCNFLPQTYTVYLSASPSIGFDIEEKSADETGFVTYVTNVTYDAAYDFTPSDNEAGKYVFWRDESGNPVDAKGTWTIVCDESIALRALFGYRLLFDDETLDPMYAFNGETFRCPKPAPVADAVFAGWTYTTDEGETILLTDADGNGLSEWDMTGRNDYELQAKWE